MTLSIISLLSSGEGCECCQKWQSHKKNKENLKKRGTCQLNSKIYNHMTCIIIQRKSNLINTNFGTNKKVIKTKNEYKKIIF